MSYVKNTDIRTKDQPLKKVKNKAIEVFRCVRQLRSYHQHKSLFDQGLVEYSFDNFDQLQNQPKINNLIKG